MAKSKAQKAMASGPSKIGAAARAAASKLKETRHLQPDQFKGRHHAPTNSSSVMKNNAGSMSAPSTGKHSLMNGKVGRRGGYNREKDIAGGYKDSVGAGYKGKHRKQGA